MEEVNPPKKAKLDTVEERGRAVVGEGMMERPRERERERGRKRYKHSLLHHCH